MITIDTGEHAYVKSDILVAIQTGDFETLDRIIPADGKTSWRFTSKPNYDEFRIKVMK